ncbi:MAG: single-stranded-DNA-specific exonuclease RecJ [Erysipelotrichaceae bacterium]
MKINHITHFTGEHSLLESVKVALQLDNTNIQDLVEPQVLPLCEQAPLLEMVARLQQAKANQERVLIAGDYDCDGICATAILDNAFSLYGLEHGFYIPNRMKEGYGLSVRTVEMAHEKGYHLILTVDNGVKAHAALEKAQELGIEVMVSDHHSYDEPPLCSHFLHPNGLSGVFHQLSGAGLALLLAAGLIGYQPYHVILAGICVVSDMVPVLAYNRTLLKTAIAYLNQGKGQALHYLCNASTFDENTIGFAITPIINAGGRMADVCNANQIVRFLNATSPEVLQQFAQDLTQINTLRKDLTSSMVQKAKGLYANEAFTIVYDPSFHEGIVGLVASRLMNDTQSPTMVLKEEEDGLLKGSIRSVQGVDLTSFFEEIAHLFVSYGGHPQAAGISFYKKDLPIISDHIQDKMQHLPRVEHRYDTILVEEAALSLAHIQSLDELRPFGVGLELPLFSSVIEIASVQKLKGMHLKITTTKRNEYLLWNANEAAMQLQEGTKLEAVHRLTISSFRGLTKWNAIIEDFSIIEAQ